MTASAARMEMMSKHTIDELLPGDVVVPKLFWNEAAEMLQEATQRSNLNPPQSHWFGWFTVVARSSENEILCIIRSPGSTAMPRITSVSALELVLNNSDTAAMFMVVLSGLP